MSNIEKKLFRQPAYWTSELTVELVSKQVKLALIAQPDTRIVDGWVSFEEISELRIDTWDHSDEVTDKTLEDLIGIIDVIEENGTRYTITISTAEISFITKVEPVIQWVEPSKPKQEWRREQLNPEVQD